MLCYCVTREHRYTIDELTQYAGGPLARGVLTCTYPRQDWSQWVIQMPQGGRPPTFLFTDLDRLPFPHQLARHWHGIKRKNPEASCLNHPTRALGRFELLRALRRSRVNRFNVHSLDNLDGPIRFPVFLKYRFDHWNPYTELLRDRAELQVAVDRLVNYISRQELMAVEFEDTGDAGGIYRKYGAYLIGGEIVPAHIQFSDKWMVRRSSLRDDRLLREDLDYVNNRDPREAELKAVFALAEIDYGRIDYGLGKAGVQVWEINTNPVIVGQDPLGPRQIAVIDNVVAAFRRLAGVATEPARA